MDDTDYQYTCHHCRPSTEPITDDDDRDTRDKSSKYRNKTKNTDDKSNGYYIRETTSMHDQREYRESDSGEYCIDYRDDALCSEYDPKSFSEFLCED